MNITTSVLFGEIRETLYNIIKNIQHKAMPDFSVLSETELTILLEYALVDYWNEKYNIEYLSNTKMHKIMFDVAESENLPITRSWYVFGGNIHEREIIRKEFGWRMLFNPQNVVLQDGSVFDIKQLAETYSEIYRILKDKIIRFIESSKIIFTPTDVYLFRLYAYKAPKKYAKCYLTSLEYRKFLTKLEKLSSVYAPEQMKIDCLEKTTQLHRVVSKIEEFTDLFELLYEFTDIIEDAVLKNAVSGPKGSLSLTQYDFFKGQTQIYVDYVWKPFAKIIAIETITGPRKDQIITEYKRDLADLSDNLLNIHSNFKRAKELNLYLTKQEFKTVFNNKKEQIGKIIEIGNFI